MFELKFVSARSNLLAFIIRPDNPHHRLTDRTGLETESRMVHGIHGSMYIFRPYYKTALGSGQGRSISTVVG